MKVSGVIVTTIIEHTIVEMDGDPRQLPPGEFGKLFMKVVLTLGQRTQESKHSEFMVTGFEPPSIEEIAEAAVSAHHQAQGE